MKLDMLSGRETGQAGIYFQHLLNVCALEAEIHDGPVVVSNILYFHPYLEK